ncbi:hypothetical protein ACFQVA_26455 [Actinomadura keratinilytica]
MPGIDECLLDIMKLPGARGAAVVDWTSGLALGTIGESPHDDHEATAAETAEVARMAAEQPAFAQESARAAAPPEDPRPPAWRTSSSPPRLATTSSVSSRRTSTAASSSTSGCTAPKATWPSPASASANWPSGWSWHETPGLPAPTAPLPAVSPMLRRLAEERATGALMRESGTLYLADGQVVHAESPATPGIDVLLTAAAPWPGRAGGRRWPRPAHGSGSRRTWWTAAGCRAARWNSATWAPCTTPPSSPSRRPAPRPASATASRTGSARSTRSRPTRWSARRCAAANCWTASGRTPPSTRHPWSASRRPPACR